MFISYEAVKEKLQLRLTFLGNTEFSQSSFCQALLLSSSPLLPPHAAWHDPALPALEGISQHASSSQPSLF